MQHVLFVGAVEKNAALLNTLHEKLIERGYPGLLGIISKLSTPEPPLKFPYVEMARLNPSGPNDIRQDEGEDIEALLALMNVTTPVDAAILWNDSNFAFSQWYKALEKMNIPIIECENSGIPYSLTFALSGTNSDALPQHDAIDEALLGEYTALFGRAKPDPAEAEDQVTQFIQQSQAEGLKTILYLGLFDAGAGNTDQDSLWYHSAEDALQEIVSALEQSGEKAAVLIKAPASYEGTLSINSVTTPLMLIPSERQTMNFMVQCNVIVTIASPLSYTAVAAGKPLVLLGRNLLSGKGVAYEATGPAMLAEALRSALYKQDWDARMMNRKQFIWDFIRNHPNYTVNAYLLQLGIKPIEALIPVLEKIATDSKSDNQPSIDMPTGAQAWQQIMQLIFKLDAQAKSPKIPAAAPV